MRALILVALLALAAAGCASTTFRDRYETLSREFDTTSDELDRARVELQRLQVALQEAPEGEAPRLLAQLEAAQLKAQIAQQKADRLAQERDSIARNVESEEEAARKSQGAWSTVLMVGGQLLMALVGGGAKKMIGV